MDPIIFCKKIQEIYQHYYRQTSYHTSYQFKPNDKQQVQIKNFQKLLQKKYNGSYGEDFLKDYFEFQFAYWNGLNTRFGKGVIMFNWLIGGKAFKRWEDKHPLYFLDKKKLTKVGIKSIKSKDVKEPYYLKLSRIEEEDKKLFYNQEEGLGWCIENTTLYNEKSKLCKSCNYKEECKEALKITLPIIYQDRNL